MYQEICIVIIIICNKDPTNSPKNICFVMVIAELTCLKNE